MRQRRDGVEVFNPKAIALGALLFLLMVTAGFFVRLAAKVETRKKLVEFQFAVDEPEPEEFDLKEPMRDILQEQVDDLREVVEVEERPDIHVTVVPSDVEVMEEVVQSRNIEVETPDIQVEATEIEVDAPEEISEVAEVVEFSVEPIAANVPGPAEVFKYNKPNPRDKPLRFTYNKAPKPSRALKVLPQQFGVQEAQSMGELGQLNANLFGSGDFFRAMTRSGGVHARSAVDAALHWLAVHQEPEGFWDVKKYEGTGKEVVGATGLSMLAFMGGGHTSRRGEYRRSVLKGLEWLVTQQDDDGKIGDTMYEQAIATIAFCEAFGRAGDERMGEAGRRAVSYLEKAHNDDGGWRYRPKSAESDVSVTAWVIQALKAAKLANIKFDHGVYAQALLFIDALTDKGAGPGTSGAVGYTYVATQKYGNMPAMTAAGMVIRQFSGAGVNSAVLRQSAELLKQQPPKWESKDFYQWYYATYAMHNMGEGTRVWWNSRIRDVLLENQSKQGDNAGSWDPVHDKWAANAGRIYTTALGALCLEVYYRYSDALSSFGVAPDLDDLFMK